MSEFILIFYFYCTIIIKKYLRVVYMNDFAKIDKNFIVETKIEKEGLKFYNCMESPFEVNGVFYENGCLRRSIA